MLKSFKSSSPKPVKAFLKNPIKIGFIRIDLSSCDVGHLFWIASILLVLYTLYRIVAIKRRYSKRRRLEMQDFLKLKWRSEELMVEACLSQQANFGKDTTNSCEEANALLIPDESGRIIHKIHFNNNEYYEAVQAYQRTLKADKHRLSPETTIGEE